MLELLASVFGRDAGWFLDQNTEVEAPPPLLRRAVRSAPVARPPHRCRSRALVPVHQGPAAERAARTPQPDRHHGQQFARLLVRVWQENRQNDFPDIERAAEAAGGRRMPLSLDDVLEIVRAAGLAIRWFDDERTRTRARMVRARFEAPATIVLNRKLKTQPERLRYTLAFFVGHKILHNGDGVVPPRPAPSRVRDRGGADGPSRRHGRAGRAAR